MTMTFAESKDAAAALALVERLQARFAAGLSGLTPTPELYSRAISFSPISWLRDEGRHGGGTRLAYPLKPQEGIINRASINISQVHYDDDPARALGSATAISTIIHPAHPILPSTHIHISWTEMKSGNGYWRIMGDLNPSIPDDNDTRMFRDAMRNASGDLFLDGSRQGDRYFHIPALARHRGVTHFYLEQFQTGHRASDLSFAETFGCAVMDAYVEILRRKLTGLKSPTPYELKSQMDYHTVYLLQVLTLDRGTTSGLLIHDQNDVGILGSLPAVIDRNLLESWVGKMPKPQDELLRSIVAAIPASGEINDVEKIKLCAALRAHYKKHPEAIEMQARGDIVPPTVTNHR